MRIVSLLPSATEILFAIGAGDSVVGVTFECDFPPEARLRAIVSNSALPLGLTPAEIDAAVSARMAAGEDIYRLDEGALKALDPDVIVTQDLCSVCAVDVANVDAALTHLGCSAKVVTVDPGTLDEVLESIVLLGQVTETTGPARSLVGDLRLRLEHVSEMVEGRPTPRVAVLEWTDPPFCAGHWLPDMVTAAGAVSALGRPGAPSSRIEWSEVAESRPDLIVVAPCGYRLDGAIKLAQEVVGLGVLPAGVPVWAVDADAAFVRPGPRLVDGVETLAAIAHPDAVPLPSDMAALVTPA